jgi:hypothetical protein
VQERLAGQVVTEDGVTVAGPTVPFTGRNRARRADRRWAQAWSPEQIAARLRRDFPDDPTMRISHEAIYQALYIEGRGALSREYVACLRTGRALRVPRARTRRARRNQRGFITPEVTLDRRPAEVTDREVPGHWEGDRATSKSHVMSGYTDWRLKFDEGVTRSSVEWIVPAPACVMGDRGVRSPGKKPKGSRSIRELRARGRPDG